MTYKEQLLHPLWKEKRDLITERDSLKCQKCNNEFYKENFSFGLIYSNELNTGVSKNYLQENKFIAHIWDLKNNSVEKVFINYSDFSLNKSYIGIYRKETHKVGRNYTQLLALKCMDKSKIKLDPSYDKKMAKAAVVSIYGKNVDSQFKWRVTAETYNEIYRKEKKEDKWELVKGLHVHHQYYQEGLFAWEYPSSALETLCWDCHETLHKGTEVPKLDSNGNEIGKLRHCKRCWGAGMFPEYVHVESGICFRCDGAKYEELI